jgi:tRNA(Ile2) C34 agmatinyltransferase TiaS
MNERCKHCNSFDTYMMPVGHNIGLYCKKCGRWLKWLKQITPKEPTFEDTDVKETLPCNGMPSWEE